MDGSTCNKDYFRMNLPNNKLPLIAYVAIVASLIPPIIYKALIAAAIAAFWAFVNALRSKPKEPA